MNKISRLVLSALVTLAVALTAAVALSAPAQAMTVAANTNTNPSTQVVKVTLSDNEIAAIKTSWYAAQVLCADTSDAIMPATSSWFDWNVPVPNGQAEYRCAGDLFACVNAGGRSVTFVNYSGFWGWQYWADTCNR